MATSGGPQAEFAGDITQQPLEFSFPQHPFDKKSI